MKFFNQLTSRTVLFLDFDSIAIDYINYFRRFFYNRIMIHRFYPTDFNYESMLERKVILKFIDHCMSIEGNKFWETATSSSLANFYIRRLEEYRDRIMFITEDDEFYESKMKRKYELFIDIPLMKLSEIEKYKVPHILVSRNKSLEQKWNSVFIYVFKNRNVSDYYIQKNIVPLFKEHKGMIYDYEIPDIRVPHKVWWKKNDITSVDLAFLNYLPEHVKINE